jgi:ABC-type transport system substrate-binding protein
MPAVAPAAGRPASTKAEASRNRLIWDSLSHPGNVAFPAIRGKDDELRRAAIGTGPFRLKEFKPSDTMVFERNPDYSDTGRPHLDESADLAFAHQRHVKGLTIHPPGYFCDLREMWVER